MALSKSELDKMKQEVQKRAEQAIDRAARRAYAKMDEIRLQMIQRYYDDYIPSFYTRTHQLFSTMSAGAHWDSVGVGVWHLNVGVDNDPTPQNYAAMHHKRGKSRRRYKYGLEKYIFISMLSKYHPNTHQGYFGDWVLVKEMDAEIDQYIDNVFESVLYDEIENM